LLDECSGEAGGRPPTVFKTPYLESMGATAVNKSGYLATMVGACNAAGEIAPPHFQLKSEAAQENQKIHINFIANSKRIRCKYDIRMTKCLMALLE
jgi:hypothetical protein